MPIDHGLEKVYDEYVADVLVLQRLGGRIAEPEPANDDVEGAAKRFQSETRQLPLAFGEEARHQVVITELHLVNLKAVEQRLRSHTKRKLAEGRFLISEFVNVHRFYYVSINL